MPIAIFLLVGIAIFFIVIMVRNHNEEEERKYREMQFREREQKLKQEEESNEFWKKLERLNLQYILTEIQDSYHLISCDSFYFEKKTNTADLFYSDEKRKTYLSGRMFAYYDWFSTFVQITNENLKKFEEYKIKVDSLYAQYYQNPNDKSTELLSRKMLRKPSFRNIHLVVKKGTYLGYGETKYENRDFWYDFFEIYKLVLEKKGKDNFIKEERAKMSDNLRYNVLSRDNFRCVICGKSRKDGIVLEVDHIIPVSKGGRTELDNLQTLCERCNRGKRDEMPTNIPSYSLPKQPVSALISKPTISQERTTINSSAYYNSPTTNTSSTSKISKAEAKQLCIKNNISISSTITFASSNDSASRKYWANPNINVLNKDWTLILNDKIGRELHVFRIPAGTIKEWQVKTRGDNGLIDLQIYYGDKSFLDSRSRCSFAPYYIKTIAY